MRFVDHDPLASRAAAARCREVAAEYRRVAAWLGTEPRGVPWWGCERDDVVRGAEALSLDLQREATSLLDAADRLELAARAALRREEELAAQAAAAALAPVPAGHPGPTGATPWLVPTPASAPAAAPAPATPPRLAALRTPTSSSTRGRMR